MNINHLKNMKRIKTKSYKKNKESIIEGENNLEKERKQINNEKVKIKEIFQLMKRN